MAYHIVPGKFPVSDVEKISSVKTVSGKSAAARVCDAGVMTDSAGFVAADAETGKGVIYVTDSVILP